MTLLPRAELNIILEEDIFIAITTSINYSRNISICELLEQVRLDLVKPEHLATMIATFSPCKSSTDCEQLITKAAFYHSNPCGSFIMKSNICG